MKPLLVLLATAALAATFTASCSSTGGGSAAGAARSDKAASTMETLRATLVGMQADVQATSDALSALVATREDAAVDPKPAYTTFAKNVGAVDARASKASSQLDALRADVQEHFAKWTADSATITDASLKKSVEKRQQSMSKVIDELGDEMQDVEKELEPFQKLLADVQTYLGNDLTPAGLKTVEGKSKTVAKDARSLVATIADAIEAIDEGAPTFKSTGA
jgi:septation ring formation regulator EzrA